MYSTIMVNLELFQDCTRLLKITGDLAERFEADVIGVSASQPIQVVYDAGALCGEVVELDRSEVEAGMRTAEQQFRAAFAHRAHRIEWRSQVAVESPSEYVARQMRGADLLITGAGPNGLVLNNTRRVNTSDLIMQAGRPVLIVPASVELLAAKHIVVGWKDTREARRAVFDALPLLKAASRVTIIKIAEYEDLAEARANAEDVVQWLHRHGIKAESISVPASGDGASQLEAIARNTGADLIVAGAYGHSRFREWALGGVTLELLQHAGICTLMSH